MHRKIINQSGFTLIEIIATVVILAVFSTIILTLFAERNWSLMKSSSALGTIYRSSDLSNVMANIYADYRPYPVWQPSTNYSSTNPTSKILPTGMNGRFYICTTAGTSFTMEPQWSDSGNPDSTPESSGVKWKAGVWQASTSYSVGDVVIPTSPNGHFYRCVTPGASGASEPLSGIWPTNNEDCSSSIPDGTGPTQVQWMELLMYLYCQIGTPDLVNKKNNIWYGQYYVLENRFVYFDNNNAIQPINAGAPQNILEVKLQSIGTSSAGTDCPGEQILTTLFTAY